MSFAAIATSPDATTKYNLRSRKNKNSLEQTPTPMPSNAPTLSSRSSLTEFSCVICFEILIEPIKLKCDHELCSCCFKSLMKSKNFTCPMCRKKIPASFKSNIEKQINASKWELIKQMYPSEVEKRMKEINLKEVGNNKENYNHARDDDDNSDSSSIILDRLDRFERSSMILDRLDRIEDSSIILENSFNIPSVPSIKRIVSCILD
jgi:hypothetical protein